MRPSLLLSLLLAAIPAAAAPLYTPDWPSLQRHAAVPGWMRDAKFGIYCHWGVYSVPAYVNEHYYNHMHNESGYSKFGTHERHVALYGPLDKFGYHDFIPLFRGEHFDADAWAELFRKGGARFAGPVAEHHDGFAMWDSALTPFNAKAMGPKRDVVGELARAIRARGMKLFLSLHHEFNYTNVRPKPGWAAADPQYAKLYGATMPRKEWLALWRDKCIEVVDKYQPDILYHDAWLEEVDPPYIQAYLAHYFNAAAARGQDVIVTYKGEDLPPGVGMLDHENSQPADIRPEPWLCDYPIDGSLAYTWGYIEGIQVRSPKEVVHKLISVVSKNGQMLLNLSPKSDGTIPADQQAVVHEVGRWLWSFGQAIYETRPFSVAGETTADGRQVAYTRRGSTLYAIVLGWPGAGQGLTLRELTPARLEGKTVAAVTLLGLKQLEACAFNAMTDGLQFTIPAEAREPSPIACVFRIELK